MSLGEADFPAFLGARRRLLANYLSELLNAGLRADGADEAASIEDAMARPETVGAVNALVSDPSDVRGGLLSRVRDELERVAAAREVITYGQLGGRIGIDLDDPAARTVLSSILGEISETEVKAGRPMLSAIVVQNENQAPGQGFFALGQLLGQVQHGEDADMFAFRQMRAVWDGVSKLTSG